MAPGAPRTRLKRRAHPVESAAPGPAHCGTARGRSPWQEASGLLSTRARSWCAYDAGTPECDTPENPCDTPDFVTDGRRVVTYGEEAQGRGPRPLALRCYAGRRPLGAPRDAHRGQGQPVKGATRSYGRPTAPLTGTERWRPTPAGGRDARGHLPPGAEERGPRQQEQETSRRGACSRSKGSCQEPLTAGGLSTILDA